MNAWELGLCAETTDHKKRRLMARRLFLVPNDEVMHHPLDLASQGEHFQRYNNVSRWLSTFVVLGALDFAAAHVVPGSVSSNMNKYIEEFPYQEVALSGEQVAVSPLC